MDNPNFSPSNYLNSQSKDNNKQRQKKIILDYLKNHEATASMVAKVTGIPQKNICRYKRNLENAGLLKQMYKALCKETGNKAWYLSTDPKLFYEAAKRLHKEKSED